MLRVQIALLTNSAEMIVLFSSPHRKFIVPEDSSKVKIW